MQLSQEENTSSAFNDQVEIDLLKAEIENLLDKGTLLHRDLDEDVVVKLSRYSPPSTEDDQKKKLPVIGFKSIPNCGLYLWLNMYRKDLGDYEVSSYPESLLPRFARIVDTGYYAETHILNSFKLALGIPLETRIGKWYRLLNNRYKGGSDAVIKISTKIVIEVKSCDNDHWNNVKTNGTRAVYPDYYVQTIQYIHNEGCKYGAVVYWNRNTCEVLVDIIKENPALSLKYIDKAANILSAKNLNEIKVEYTSFGSKDSHECSQCPFRSTCYNL